MKPRRKSSFWYSKIESYKHCPQKYRYQYLEGVKAGTALSADLAFGTALHGGLEAHFSGSDPEETFSLLWEHAQLQGLAYGRFGWDYLNSIGPQLLRKFIKAYAKDIEPVILEERLFGKFGTYDFEGTPDIIGRFRGVPSVIDFKTSAYRYEQGKILVASQLMDYANLARQNNVDPVPEQIVYFVFVKQSASIQKPLIRRVSSAELDAAQQRTIEWIDIVKRDKVLPRNTSGCIRGPLVCEYFDKCWRNK